MFYCPYYFFRKNMGNNKVYIIDRKKGDVNGDKVEDTILLIGNKPSDTDSPFVSNIRLVIKDGKQVKALRYLLKKIQVIIQLYFWEILQEIKLRIY